MAMKSYKFRIYPNKEQITLINKTIGCARFVFNYSLSKQQEKDKMWYIAEEMYQCGNFLVIIGRVNFSTRKTPLRI